MLNKVFSDNYLYQSPHTFSLMKKYAKNQGDSPFESFFSSHKATLTRAEKLSNRTESPYPRTQRTLVQKFCSIQDLSNLDNYEL